MGRIQCWNCIDQSSYSVGVLDFCSPTNFFFFFCLVFFLFQEKVICKTFGKSFRSKAKALEATDHNKLHLKCLQCLLLPTDLRVFTLIL